MYKCKHFDIRELVTPQVYKKYGEKSWQFFDVGVLQTLDKLRDVFGPLTVNDWCFGGQFKERGLRSLDYGGAENRSLHKSGKAIDCVSNKYSAEEMRQYVLSNRDKFPHITAIEANVSWFHWDNRNRGDGSIMIFNP